MTLSFVRPPALCVFSVLALAACSPTNPMADVVGDIATTDVANATDVPAIDAISPDASTDAERQDGAATDVAVADVPVTDGGTGVLPMAEPRVLALSAMGHDRFFGVA
jgi:hypothetical protein